MVERFYIDRNKRDRFIEFETFQNPYGGPRGRAINALKQTDLEPIKPIEFFYYLRNNYRRYLASIEWVRFHKFKEGKNDYAVAIVNLRPNIEVREGLFEVREKITIETGWYPLIMGSKARIHLPEINRRLNLLNRELIGSLELNRLISIEIIQSKENCFKVNFDGGNILLDTGFQSSNAIDEQTKFIFISHFHKDHSGGLTDIIFGDYSVPILISLPTFNSLWHINNVELRNKANERRAFLNKLEEMALIVKPQDNLKIGDKSELYIFESYHCPGSIGVKITDSSGKNLVYFGDVCLRNGFLDYIDFFKDQLVSDTRNSGPTTFLLDSTFIKKRYENIPYTQAPKEILDLLKPGREIPNVWFISKQVETLVYLFLYFFIETRKIYGYPKKLFLDNTLINLLQSLWSAYAQKTIGRIDPFLREEILKEKTNFIESHRVYPLYNSILKDLPEEEKVIGFYSESHFMEQCAEFSEADKAKLFKNSRLYLIGRIESFANSDVDPDLRDIVYSLNPMSFEKLASADWLFHSNQDDLQEIICWLSELKDTMIILFHNDLQNLNDFIAENQFDTDKVKCFDNSKIDL